jgi:hypothetical protein
MQHHFGVISVGNQQRFNMIYSNFMAFQLLQLVTRPNDDSK